MANSSTIKQSNYTREQVFPVNGGEDEKSYVTNSSLQKKGVDAANVFIREGILEKLDIDQLNVTSSPTNSHKAFNIVDMGCAVGANTLAAVQNVIDSVKLKLNSHGLDHIFETLEFHVFFNDLVTSDFNTVFRSLPSGKPYYAAGVPGSFYGRLFPKSTLHFVYSGYSLHWLSKVPEGVADKSSPAYNKGKIYWTSSPREVVEAYEAQFARDIDAFLSARALEVVSGGLIAFSIVSVPPDAKCITPAFFELMGTVLLDLASNKGLTTEEKVNSFNLPVYLPTPPQLEALLKKNPDFTLERIEPLHRPRDFLYEPEFPAQITKHYRAVLEGLITDHFGSEIVNDFFDQFKEKVKETSVFLDLSYKQVVETFVLLKRKPYN